jgi:hypothetical protein
VTIPPFPYGEDAFSTWFTATKLAEIHKHEYSPDDYHKAAGTTAEAMLQLLQQRMDPATNQRFTEHMTTLDPTKDPSVIYNYLAGLWGVAHMTQALRKQ